MYVCIYIPYEVLKTDHVGHLPLRRWARAFDFGLDYVIKKYLGILRIIKI